MFVWKREFEGGVFKEEIERVCEWIKSWEYCEKNFVCEVLIINFVKVC